MLLVVENSSSAYRRLSRILQRGLARRMFLRLIAASFLFATPAHAITTWTNWTSFTAGTLGGGSAAGSAGGVGVSYSGELNSAVINGSSLVWAPASSFTGGTVTVSPSVVGDDLRLDGSFTGTNTITFASPVDNPVFAIWSLGSPSLAAFFNFNATPTLEAGGPNSQFGGSSAIVSEAMKAMAWSSLPALSVRYPGRTPLSSFMRSRSASTAL
jgi:hypothetical protein